jgi:hypothetical protein
VQSVHDSIAGLYFPSPQAGERPVITRQSQGQSQVAR